MVGKLWIVLAAVPLSMGLKMNSMDPIKPNLEQLSFEDFVKQFQRTYKPGTAEWSKREGTFNANKLQALQHLKNKGHLAWKPGINQFMDWTKAEKEGILTFKPHRANRKGKQLLKDNSLNHSHTLDMSKSVPDMIDWSTHASLKLTGKYIRDQGSCGSCWAVSTASVMEAHLELAQKDHLIELGRYDNDFTQMALSSQSLVSCVENPHHCGGSGGCEGATAPLAFEHIMLKGMPWGLEYLYTSGNGRSGDCLQKKGVVTIENYVNLPENEELPILQALVQSGPVVMGVAANGWFSYSKGVFHLDHADYVINHAVAGFGFGKDPESGRLYWLIKNSWGQFWGEDGFMRLERKMKEDCGMDDRPQDGDACDGETDPIKVCGICGALYLTSYPVGVKFMK